MPSSSEAVTIGLFFAFKWYILSLIVQDFTRRLLFSVLLSFLYFLLRSTDTKANLPPKVRGLPIIGILPWFVYYKPYVYITMLAKRYGSMIRFSLGRANVVFINDYELSKQMSAHPDFQGRPNFGILHDFTQGMGIVAAEGPQWKHQRRFTMHALKDSGMGKLHMQEKIVSELRQVVQEIEKYSGSAVPIREILGKSTCNIICSLAFNKQFEYDDPVLIRRIHNLDQNFRLLEQLNFLSAFWWLRPLLQFKKKVLLANDAEFKGIAQNLVEQHRNTLDENNPRDLIDLFLMEMSQTSSSPEEKEYYGTFFEEQLFRLIADLFAAGTETTSTTIRWAILYMMYHPEIQTKIQQEIDEVIGSERMPNISDKSSLPLTVATLQEVERLACVAPASLQRCNPNPAKFNGYDFPARTVFHFNFFAIHRDPALWKKPEKFDPTRFIDDSGSVFRPPQLMAFGSGKRACPGESLAKVEVFLYFTTLLQNFRFEPFQNRLPSLESGSGFVRAPYPYKVRAVKRN